MKSRLPTIRDVAAHAGVSVGTASKALNNQGRLSLETRAAVARAAEKLHFAPNALIRSLQCGKTGAVGVLTWSVRADGHYSIRLPLLEGISLGLSKVQSDLLLYSHYEGRNEVHATATQFLDGRIDGVILSPYLSIEVLESLALAGLPTVALYREPVPDKIGFVGIDNRSGMHQAVAHLVALGHRRIAFYAAKTSFDLLERRKGYEEALEHFGLPLDPSLCKAPEHYVAQVPQDAAALLALKNPPTALIAADDHVALTWASELRARGLKLPEQMSLVGFDDAPGVSAAPGLTTIRQPAVSVGETAAFFVDQMIHGTPAEECRRVLPVELIVRGTTGPPR